MRGPGNLRIDRRELMLGAAALGGLGAFGMTGGARAQAGGVALGDMEVTSLSDGSLTLPIDFALPDRSRDEIAALFEPRGLPVDALRPDCNVTLMRSGDRVVLFDAGSGPMFQDTAGRLPESLAAAGVDPSEVTDVVFTHAHPDHLWGVLDDFDEPVFSDAKHWVPQTEWDYWRAESTLAETPEERQAFVVGARNRFAAIEETVSFVKPGDEVLAGVEAVDTSGHTPGHMSYMLHGGGESLLVVGDALTNAVLSFEKPGWHSGTDQDPEKAARTRQELLDRIVADKVRILGFHLPHPGVGTAERQGDAYRFVPA